jgi:hypothetical protein
MAAPIGNQFWKLRSKHGRDYLFGSPEELWTGACEYFNWCDGHPWRKNELVKSGDMAGRIIGVPTARPYTMQGLCGYLDCNTMYFNEFDKALQGKEDERSKDFSRIVTRIREIVYQQKFEGAAVGAFNSSIIARDLGLAEKQENRNVDKDGNDVVPPSITVIKAGENPGFEIKEEEE